MKRGILEINFPSGKMEFHPRLPKEAKVVGFVLLVVDRTSPLAIPGQENVRLFEEVPTMIVEVDASLDETAELEERHFFIMPSGAGMEGDQLTWLGMALAKKPGVGLLHLYEETKHVEKQEEP
jgi:hypothetical protein